MLPGTGYTLYTMCANFAAERGRLSRPARAAARDAGKRPLATKLERGRRFLYEDVAQELRLRIARGLYPRGSRIPSESELVRG